MPFTMCASVGPFTDVRGHVLLAVFLAKCLLLIHKEVLSSESDFTDIGIHVVIDNGNDLKVTNDAVISLGAYFSLFFSKKQIKFMERSSPFKERRSR